MAPETSQNVSDHGPQYEALPDEDLPTVATATAHSGKSSGKHHAVSPTPRSKARAWLWTILFQVFAVLWLVPIIALLLLNFSSHIIGATAWCPSGHCYVDMFNFDPSVPENNIARFAVNDRNLTSALQLVAKVLERWFEFIAASLMYLILVKIANNPEGLPVGLMTRHVQFSDLVRCFHPLNWRILPAWQPKNERRRSIVSIWGFMVLSVVLAILCNLMGPATAVLVIPNLRWVQTPMEGDMYMHSLNAANPPTRNARSSLLDQCEDEDIRNKAWSCVNSKFDATVAGSAFKTHLCRFYINTTLISFTDLNWVPNALTVNDMDRDFAMLMYMSTNVTLDPAQADDLDWQDKWLADAYRNFKKETPSFTEYNKSLEVQLQRTGPVLATYDSFWNNDVSHYLFSSNKTYWMNNVTIDRQIRCYPYYQAPTIAGAFGNNSIDFKTNNFTRCIQVGPGWGEATKQETFYIKGRGNPAGALAVYDKRESHILHHSRQSNDTDPTDGWLEQTIKVNVFSSDRAVLLPNGNLPDGVPLACLNREGPLPTTCDWDSIFSNSTPPFFSNLTKYPVTVEYILQSSEDEDFEGYAVVNDFVAFMGFTNYTLDTSRITNPTSLVRTRERPYNVVPVPVDPNWVLAAWAADAGGTLSANRSTTISILNQFADDTWSVYDNEKSFASEQQDPTTLRLVALNTLSMLEYERDGTPPTSENGTSIRLQRHALINVWTYGISSRTAYLGVIVAIGGCVIVVLQVIVGLTDTRERRSLWQLLAAGLEYKPEHDLKELQSDKQAAVAKVRFRLEEIEGAGKFQFLPPNTNLESPRRRKNKPMASSKRQGG